MAMLITDLKFSYADFTVDVKSLEVNSITGLWGPSGSGKSTLLDCIAGLLKPSYGRIELNSSTVFDSQSRIFAGPHKRRIGIVFQDDRLFPHLNVIDNLRYGQPDSDSKTQHTKLLNIANAFEIDRFLYRKPDSLSGGQKKRVSIARAILSEPDMLLLDEPFAGLDTGIRNKVVSFIKRLQFRNPVPMILVSHNLYDIVDLTSEIIYINHGRIIIHGQLEDLYTKAEFYNSIRDTGIMNILDLRLNHIFPEAGVSLYNVLMQDNETSQVSFCGPLSDGGCLFETYRAVLNSNDVTLALNPVENVSVQNIIPGEIISIHSLDSAIFCKIDLGGITIMSEITNQARKDMRLEIGKKIWVLFKAHALKLLSVVKSEFCISSDMTTFQLASSI